MSDDFIDTITGIDRENFFRNIDVNDTKLLTDRFIKDYCITHKCQYFDYPAGTLYEQIGRKGYLLILVNKRVRGFYTDYDANNYSLLEVGNGSLIHMRIIGNNIYDMIHVSHDFFIRKIIKGEIAQSDKYSEFLSFFMKYRDQQLKMVTNDLLRVKKRVKNLTKMNYTTIDDLVKDFKWSSNILGEEDI